MIDFKKARVWRRRDGEMPARKDLPLQKVRVLISGDGKRIERETREEHVRHTANGKDDRRHDVGPAGPTEMGHDMHPHDPDASSTGRRLDGASAQAGQARAQKPDARTGRLGHLGQRRSISRVLSRIRVAPEAVAIIPLRTAVARRLKRPTRRLGRATLNPGRRFRPRPGCLPTWPCSRWGLPCHPRYRGRGGLLPRRFTLTAESQKRAAAVCFLWHSPQRYRYRALPGIVLCGARTFLPMLTAHRTITRAASTSVKMH
jgi:hypothetical protein